MSATDPSAVAPPDGPTPEAQQGPIALDGLAYGIDLLDALLVFHLGDAHIHGLWVRPEGGVRPEDVVTTLRDAYRVGQFAGKRLMGAASARAEAPAPLLTLELPQRTAMLRRIRTWVVATIFDAAMPLGMARLISARLAGLLEFELPLGPEPTHDGLAGGARPRVPAPAAHEPALHAPAEPVRVPAPPGMDASPLRPVVRASDEGAPHTLTFGSGLPRRSHPPPPAAELDRTSRLLAYLEAHAPEPHVVRHRLALRAGLTLSALDHPAGLAPEAIVLIETAVQDILGIDRAELRRIA